MTGLTKFPLATYKQIHFRKNMKDNEILQKSTRFSISLQLSPSEWKWVMEINLIVKTYIQFAGSFRKLVCWFSTERGETRNMGSYSKFCFQNMNSKACRNHLRCCHNTAAHPIFQIATSKSQIVGLTVQGELRLFAIIFLHQDRMINLLLQN